MTASSVTGTGYGFPTPPVNLFGVYSDNIYGQVYASGSGFGGININRFDLYATPEVKLPFNIDKLVSSQIIVPSSDITEEGAITITTNTTGDGTWAFTFSDFAQGARGLSKSGGSSSGNLVLEWTWNSYPFTAYISIFGG